MRCLTPEVCAAVMAANLSFFACLHGLQRFGSFFSPLSWKNACSPDVQMKLSLQSTHLIVRSGCSGCSGSRAVSNSPITSPSDMMSSPWVDRSACRWRAPLESGVPVFKKEPLFFLASIGVSVGAALEQVERMREKYNYGEIVSRQKWGVFKKLDSPPPACQHHPFSLANENEQMCLEKGRLDGN